MDGPVSLIKVNMHTDYCMFITRFGETEVTEWKKKQDPIHEILELLSDDKVKEFQTTYYSEDAFYEDGEE